MDDNDGLAEFLIELLEGEHLDGAAAGITRRVIDRGLESLTDKQKFVFERDVMTTFGNATCDACENEIPMSEKAHALQNGGMCNYCWHMMEKLKNE
ncbi:hypothetical protein [Pseudolysobacter antarcticus]|nr:hypothetical protein [Pseudolysobacter antarcticus]